MIYDAIPLSIKNLPTKKGTNHSLQYSQKNGFTDNICILPPIPGFQRGGAIKFGNYRQYQQAAETFLDAYQKAPQGPKAADNMLKLGMSLGRLDRKQEACATLAGIPQLFPTAAATLRDQVTRVLEATRTRSTPRPRCCARARCACARS